MTLPFSCAHTEGHRTLPQSGDVCAWPHRSDAPRVGEGFCPHCPVALQLIVDPPFHPNRIGRCPCCLGRYSVKDGEIHSWRIPLDRRTGHEAPSWTWAT